MNKKELYALAESKTEFNSNNGWGFGGAYGTSYKFKNNVEVRDATACYRHLPSHKFVTVRHNGDCIIDVQKLSQDHIQTIFNLIQ